MQRLTPYHPAPSHPTCRPPAAQPLASDATAPAVVRAAATQLLEDADATAIQAALEDADAPGALRAAADPLLAPLLPVMAAAGGHRELMWELLNSQDMELRLPLGDDVGVMYTRQRDWHINLPEACLACAAAQGHEAVVASLLPRPPISATRHKQLAAQAAAAAGQLRILGRWLRNPTGPLVEACVLQATMAGQLDCLSAALNACTDAAQRAATADATAGILLSCPPEQGPGWAATAGALLLLQQAGAQLPASCSPEALAAATSPRPSLQDVFAFEERSPHLILLAHSMGLWCGTWYAKVRQEALPQAQFIVARAAAAPSGARAVAGTSTSTPQPAPGVQLAAATAAATGRLGSQGGAVDGQAGCASPRIEALEWLQCFADPTLAEWVNGGGDVQLLAAYVRACQQVAAVWWPKVPR